MKTGLVEQFVQGDEAAFAQLVEIYQEPTLRFAHSLFGDHDQKYGADLSARDARYGGTPLGWAEENSQDGAAAYLRKLAAKD